MWRGCGDELSTHAAGEMDALPFDADIFEVEYGHHVLNLITMQVQQKPDLYVTTKFLLGKGRSKAIFGGKDDV